MNRPALEHPRGHKGATPRLRLLFIGMLVISLGSCQTPQDQGITDGVKITDLTTGEGGLRDPGELRRIGETIDPTVPRLVIRRLMFRRLGPEMAVELARLEWKDDRNPEEEHRLIVLRHLQTEWQQLRNSLEGLQQATLPEQAQQAWGNSGLKLSELQGTDVIRWFSDLPRAIASTAAVSSSYSEYTAMDLVENVAPGQHVLICNSDGKASEEVLSGGDYRLLAKLEPGLAEQTQPMIDLLPQLHQIKASLLPRTRSETMLDGETFDALHVYQPFDVSRMWVIWAAGHIEGQAGAQSNVRTLGQAMLHGSRKGESVELVILISTR